MEKIGITTTIPIEIVFASGYSPKDLNNIFITDVNALSYVEEAEKHGFSRNMCAWIKGIYSAVKKHDIKKVIAVTEGDCSNNHNLIEILRDEGVEVFTFSYPHDRDKQRFNIELFKLASCLDVCMDDVLKIKEKCDNVRKYAEKIDNLTWEKGLVTGKENHYWLVNCSDFMGDLDVFERRITKFIAECSKKEKIKVKYRLGYVGVPPIVSDLYEKVESLDACVVYNEVQRQFSMPYKTKDLLEQYLKYTYPYSVWQRIEDIKEQVKLRNIHGLVHYVQSFCHRQMDDILLRKYLDVPILTIESDKPGVLGARNRIKLEAFLEML